MTVGPNSQTFSYLTKNRAGQAGQTGFDNLNGRLLPWVFFRFEFSANDGECHTSFGSASDNPNGPDLGAGGDYSLMPTMLIYRRYYNLDDDSWHADLIQTLNNDRYDFLFIGTLDSNEPYHLTQ